MLRGLVTLAALGFGLAPAIASAQTASVRVQVIHANHSGSIDSALGSTAAQLRSRFGQYSGFALLGTHSLSIPNGGSQSIGLPGGSAVVSFQGMSGRAYQLRVAMGREVTAVRSAPGGSSFVAGPGYSGGIIILYIST